MTQWQRRAEARAVPADWIPAFAGMTQWQRRAEARATASLHADELYVEDDGLVRADRRLRGVAVGLLGRQHDFPARAGRHLRQRFAQAHQRDLVELHAHRAGLLAFGRADGVDERLDVGRQRALVVDRHFAGLGVFGPGVQGWVLRGAFRGGSSPSLAWQDVNGASASRRRTSGIWLSIMRTGPGFWPSGGLKGSTNVWPPDASVPL